MLIINADDWGGNRVATDNSLLCFKKGRITSVSAMVFMADSERAAELALEYGLDVGLHLNFTLKFNGKAKSGKLIECQQRIACFLNRNKYCFLIYNPLLRREFQYVYSAQNEEYLRLYNKMPTHIDGHRHMHLCTNMLVGRLIPVRQKVRRNFTFLSGEKTIFNIFYRRYVDAILTRRYISTDFFFSASPPWQAERLQSIVNLAKARSVELMVHPERNDEMESLMSDDYLAMISDVKRDSYASL